MSYCALGTIRESNPGMVHPGYPDDTDRARAHDAGYPGHALSALERSDIGAVVVDAHGAAIYMNEAAKTLLQCPSGILPRWSQRYVTSMLAALDAVGHAAERWDCGALLLRVEAWPLARAGCRAVFEITLARRIFDHDRALPRRLSRALRLRSRDARLLALLWRGMSDEEIAAILRIPPSRIVTSLAGLYQKLGVARRPAAVMRAAAALAG